MISSGEDEPPPRKPAPVHKTKAKPAQNLPIRVNGTAAKPKGKAKADPPVRRESNAMDVDEVQAVVPDSTPLVRPAKSRSTSKPSPAVTNQFSVRRENRELESTKGENERLQKRLDDVFTFLYYHSSTDTEWHDMSQADERNRKLSAQLEKLMQIRLSEPEQLMDERVAQYETTLKGVCQAAVVCFRSHAPCSATSSFARAERSARTVQDVG